MLLNPSYLLELLNSNNIKINKCIHIGAHKCEELPIYINMGFVKDDIIWIEGNNDMIEIANNNNITIYNYVITDKDNDDIILYKANDTASSSILDIARHKEVYPDISYITKSKSKSITIDTFFDTKGINATEYDFFEYSYSRSRINGITRSHKIFEICKSYIHKNTRNRII